MRRKRKGAAVLVLMGFGLLILIIFFVAVGTPPKPPIAQSTLAPASSTTAPTLIVKATTAAPTILATPPAVSLAREENLLFVLVASGSLRTLLNGTPKLAQIQSSVGSASSMMADKTKVGMVTYVLPGQAKDCQNIALRSPLGSDQQKLLQNLGGIEAKGGAPLAEALRSAEQEFEPGRENYVILLAETVDGCGGDPINAAMALSQSDVGAAAFVIALAPDAAARVQLSQIASTSGGKYYQASNSQELNEALIQVMKDIDAIADPGQVYLNAALARWRQKRYDDAIRKLTLSVRVQPDYAEGYGWWAQVLSEKAQSSAGNERAELFMQATEKANRALELQARKSSPRGAAVARNVLGVVAIENHDLSAAVEHLTQALKLDATSAAVPLFRQGLGQAYIARGLDNIEQHRPDWAQSDCNQPEAQALQTPALHLCMGLAYSYQGKTDSALKEFTAVLGAQPNHVVALTQRAHVYRLTKDYGAALRDLTAAVQFGSADSSLTPLDHASIYSELGYLQLAVGQGKEAKDSFQRARDLDPEDPDNSEAYVGTGWALLTINFDDADPNRRKEAIGYLSHALDDFGIMRATTFRELDSAALALRLRAKALWKDRVWSGAIGDCTSSLRLDPNAQKDSSCFFYRGEAYFQQRQWNEAQNDLTQFLAVSANDPVWAEQVKLARSELDKIKLSVP